MDIRIICVQLGIDVNRALAYMEMKEIQSQQVEKKEVA